MSVIRRQVLFSGTVQGVAFRATTREVAGSFKVTGYVRNLPDGRVELVAEGEEAELSRFVSGVQKAMIGFIRETRSSDSAARGEFDGFAVRM